MNILWIEDNENIEELEKKFFKNHPEFKNGHNKITIPKNFDDSFDAIENAAEEFDFIVFDIDLTNFEIGEKGQKLAQTSG
jgi:response regulator of citrate/malate metabolism